MSKKVNLKIETPSPSNDKTSYSLTTSGTFKEGDLAINKKGLLIKGESPKNSPITINEKKKLHSNLNPQSNNAENNDIQNNDNQNFNSTFYNDSMPSTPTSSNSLSTTNTSNININNINFNAINSNINNMNNYYNNSSNNNYFNSNKNTNNNRFNSNNNNSSSNNNNNNNNNNININNNNSNDGFNNYNPSSLPQYDPNLTLDLKDLKILKVIGKGAGGIVKLAYHHTSDTYFALKVITLDIQENIRKQIILELKTLHKTYCPYVVSFYDAFYTEGSVFIALEFMELGSLTDILKRCKTIPEPVIGRIAYQVLQGLVYLHRKLHLIHRDIKPSNILVNGKGDAKISDFGVSGQLQHTLSKAVTWVGTVTYMSPERISGRSYSFDSDIWSLGLTILECAIGKFPYGNPQQLVLNTQQQQQQQINNSFSNDFNNNSVNSNGEMLGEKNSFNSLSSNGGIGFWVLLDCIVKEDVPNVPDNFSKEFKSFISACLQKEPEERPTASTLLQHEFIKKYQNVDTSKWFSQLLNSPQ